MAWKPLKTSSNNKMSYAIDASGNVRSKSKRTGKTKILKKYKRSGYGAVSIPDGKAKKVSKYNHQLQMSGTKNSGRNNTVDHKNSNRMDASRKNLRKMSRRENGRRGGLKSAGR